MLHNKLRILHNYARSHLQISLVHHQQMIVQSLCILYFFISRVSDLKLDPSFVDLIA